ncbi:MAG TPA: protein kinase [Trichocoleus sp.]|jgi:serine/threonine protein kinase
MATSIELTPGTLLQNRYRVLQAIGSGGFSCVFEVETEGATKILKVLDASSFGYSQYQKAIDLFQREAEVLSQVNHPGIPQIEPEGYFVWKHDGQVALHCLAMEKIPGLTLQQWFQKHRSVLSQEQAIDWLRQLVDILAHLHQQQFFHRDIKPSNIMLRPDGQLVLIDFGAVREVTVTYLVKQQQQETGTAIVSAGYTPPEQAEGQAVPQSDFFALGRTFVYLLTGKDPYELPKDPQTGRLCWHDHAPPLLPTLATLIDQMMAPVVGQRPVSCEAIEQTLKRIERQLLLQHWLPFLASLGQLRKHPWLARGWLRPTRFKAMLVMSLLFAGFNVWNDRISISDQFNNWGLDAVQSKQFDAAWWYYQSALLFNSQNFETIYNLGDLYESRQQFDNARVAYLTAIKGGKAEAYNNLARLYIQSKPFKREVISLLKEGLQKAQDGRDRYALYKNLGWAYLQLNQYQEAQQALQTAIALNPNKGAAYCLMAQVHEATNSKAAMLAAWQQCLDHADRNNTDEQIWIARAHQFLQSSEVQP